MSQGEKKKENSRNKINHEGKKKKKKNIFKKIKEQKDMSYGLKQSGEGVFEDLQCDVVRSLLQVLRCQPKGKNSSTPVVLFRDRRERKRVREGGKRE